MPLPPAGVTLRNLFWKLLRDGRDAVSEIPSSRWDIDAFYDSDPKTYRVNLTPGMAAFLDQR